jgi:poly(3-hydroxybutyrate) depolymerase
VNYEGDQSFFGLRTALSLIANANGCTSNDEKSMIIDDNYITEYSSTSCTNNATVVLYAIAGVGHFPYLDFPFSEPPETVVTKADTTQAAWDFLKTHSLQEVPELIVYDMPTFTSVSAVP